MEPVPTSYNPFTSPSVGGVANQQQGPMVDTPFDLIYDVVLSANQSLQDIVAVGNDANFAWRAVVINFATGIFAVRFASSSLYYLSNQRIVSTNLSADPASPYPIVPELVVPAGGRINLDLLEMTGAPNTIQLVFRGVKRFAN